MVWGVKKTATKGQEHLISDADKFLKACQKRKFHVLLPTIVISELLTPEPIISHPKLMKQFSKFAICEFNTKASIIFGQIMQDRYADLKEYRATNTVRKDKMKFDCAIVATALAFDAQMIYSHDSDILLFAKDRIEVKKLSDDMFSEIKENG
jgi:hypothetical protein